VAEWPEFSPTGLLTALTARDVDFVVIGGIAMVLYGSARVTRDLDVAYAPTPANLKALGESLIDLGATLRGVEETLPFAPDDRTLRRTEILCLSTSAGPIDLLLAPPGAPAYATLKKRAERVELVGGTVLVASLDDLEAMKRAADRPQDRIDLEEIEVIRRLRAGA
jgi:Nucleotidyl transferase AbiEii toxin, Type IV TA system